MGEGKKGGGAAVLKGVEETLREGTKEKKGFTPIERLGHDKRVHTRKSGNNTTHNTTPQ